MNKHCLTILALSGLALSAQDRGVSLLYTLSSPKDYTVPAGGPRFETDTYKGLGLRYSHTVGKAFGGARLDFEGTWKVRTSGSDLKQNGVNVNTGSTTYAMRQESLGLGLSATWTRTVDFGAALDLRQDNTSLQLKANTGEQVDFDQSTVRPWLGVRVGYTVPTGAFRPSFGLEYGIPLMKKAGGDLAFSYDLGRKLRPKSELTLSAGLRF